MVSEGVRVGMISWVRVGRGERVGVGDVETSRLAVSTGGEDAIAVLRVADDVGETTVVGVAEAGTVAGGCVGAGPHPATLRAAATRRHTRSKIILDGGIIIWKTFTTFTPWR